MKQQPTGGLAAAESLYSFVKNEENVVTPTLKINHRPSLTPGVEYPISEREELLLDAGYHQGYTDALRIERAGRHIDDPLLIAMLEQVELIRKERGLK